MTDDFEKPVYFPGKLRLMEKLRPHNFLLTGMSDFAGWSPAWRDEVFAKMEQNPQHQYIFLTKRPETIHFSSSLDNAWFGVTVTSRKETGRIGTLRENICGCHYLATFEPMFDDIGSVDFTGIDWVVIGTETGRRKNKSVSRPEWVWSLTEQAHALDIPVFMKEDLLPIIGENNMVQELPPAFSRVLEEQKAWQK
jgi:radical SAM mobile pair protein A